MFGEAARRAAFGRMKLRKFSRTDSNAAFGLISEKTIVCGSGEVMPVKSLLKSGPFCQSVMPTTLVHRLAFEAWFGFDWSFQEKMTSSAVSPLPSLHLRFGLRWMVQVF